QAEDGIRDRNVTGVQTCALPILGLSEKIAEIIREAGVEVFIYPKAEPNPTDKNVEDGLKAYQDENCDSITTLGGGSSHDAGKAIENIASIGVDSYDDDVVD